MKNRFKYILVFCLLLSCCTTAFASADSTVIAEEYRADNDGYNAEMEEDTLAAGERKLSEEEWRYLTLDPAFSYRKERENEQLITNKKEANPWYLKALKSILMFLASGAGQIIFWGIVAGILAYVVFKMFKGSFSLLINKKQKVMAVESHEELSFESLITANWDAKMKEALLREDYRLATRFSFLSILQKLHEKGHIHYRLDTTNYAYFLSLKNKALQSIFKKLLLKYEYAWFGKFPMNKEEWQKVADLFNQVKNEL